MNLVKSSVINHHVIYNVEFISHQLNMEENQITFCHSSPLMMLVNLPP